MTSGPGITGKTDSPDDAIEEISGLLEMDELKASEAAEGGSEPAHQVSEEVGEALDVAMETPSPAKLDAYLPPPPVSEEPAKEESAEAEAETGSNMAYEDLLEKLVLPAQPAPVDEPAAHQVTPRPIATQASSPPESLFPTSLTPGPATSDERTVVTVNPLLAEEQEAAARGAESYILPAAPPPQPLLPNTPVVVPQARPATAAKSGGRFIQTSYPVFGGIVLGGILLGVLVGRVSAPTKVVEKVTVVQAPPVAAPPAPVQAAQAANPNPSPEVVPLPTTPKPTAQPAAVAEPAQPAAVAAQPEAEEPPAEEAKPEPKPKAHHASKASRPAKAAAKPAPAAKPVAAAKPAAPAAKPAGGKKPGKGWVDPFAN